MSTSVDNRQFSRLLWPHPRLSVLASGLICTQLQSVFFHDIFCIVHDFQWAFSSRMFWSCLGLVEADCWAWLPHWAGFSLFICLLPRWDNAFTCAGGSSCRRIAFCFFTSLFSLTWKMAVAKSNFGLSCSFCNFASRMPTILYRIISSRRVPYCNVQPVYALM